MENQGDTFRGIRAHEYFASGTIFANRYLIERKLGEGGMGAVYKATDKMLRIPVALKVMSIQITNNEDALERFRREVIFARKVSHPNVCRIYDISESDSIYYVSMEYLEGKTLADLLESKGRLMPDLGVSIAKQVLGALQEAHRVGVIHRDLKPQNIMVDSNQRASIMDFGISISADVSRLTQTGSVAGTITYMAPEQLEGREIDRRVDIYAMGLILFEILTGRLPFDVRSPGEVIAAHLKGDFRRPSEFIPDFPPVLEKIILRALEKKVEKRYQSAAEFLQALEACESAIPSRRAMEDAPTRDDFVPSAPLPQETIPEETLKHLLRARPTFLIAILIVLLATAATWFYFSKTTQVPSSPAPPVATAVVLNALPWAHVKVVPLSNNIRVEVPAEEGITPCNFLLPEGEYSVELSNDAIPKSLIKRIKVRAGQKNFFEFQMPSYDSSKIASQVP